MYGYYVTAPHHFVEKIIGLSSCILKTTAVLFRFVHRRTCQDLPSPMSAGDDLRSEYIGDQTHRFKALSVDITSPTEELLVLCPLSARKRWSRFIYHERPVVSVSR